jgi:hypothetical protein
MSHLTCENIYEATNLRRVGSLERDKPLSAGSRPWGTILFGTFRASALFELFKVKCVRVV